MITPSLLTLAAFLATQSPITADDAKTPASILKKSDDQVSNYKDQEYVTRMTLLSAEGKVEKVIEMKILQKGGNKRLARFLKPGDVKGLSVLVVNGNTYVYLPQFNKVRRVAAHSSKHGFMGTDFTEQEMDIIRYDTDFDPTLLRKEGHEYVLKLTPKPGKDFAFAYIHMWIDERDGLQTRMEYYNADNVKLKTQERGGTMTLDGVYTQTKVLMTDHLRKHSTQIEILSTKQDQGLKDDLFTQRNLEWGK
jgi:outer membrane lipoprotein-sorting protein